MVEEAPFCKALVSTIYLFIFLLCSAYEGKSRSMQKSVLLSISYDSGLEWTYSRWNNSNLKIKK